LIYGDDFDDAHDALAIASLSLILVWLGREGDRVVKLNALFN
jgi:hypothetical protein